MFYVSLHQKLKNSDAIITGYKFYDKLALLLQRPFYRENSMSDDYPTVSISYQPIELCKLLKIANMVSGGGEAKIVIGEGYVYLNGEVEFQKRKKIYDSDIIEFNGELVQVVCSKPASTSEDIKQAKAQKAKTAQSRSSNKNSKSSNKNTQQHAIAQETPMPSTPAKRRPISF